MLQPQSAILKMFNDIIFDLNELVAQVGLDEFTLARKLNALETRAFDLKERGEIGLSFSALGSIAAARGNEASMNKFHRKSVEHLPHPAILRNYAVSMRHLGLTSKAAAFMEEVYKDHPDDAECLEYLVKLCYDEGDEKKFVRYAEAFKALTGKPHPFWEGYLQEIEEAHALSRICTRASAPSLLRQ